jgi:hypothetical protein
MFGKFLSLFLLFLGATAMLAQTGCVGATAKGPTNTNSTTTSSSSAPAITGQPVSQTVTTGQAATFSAAASGSGPLAFQWYRNGAPISGATGSSYTTAATVAADNGAQFSVTVSNSTGSVTSNAAGLVVLSATVSPTISSQPVGQSVTVGQTATFSVGASGTSPFTYQWYKNGAAIGGAAGASYITPATVAGDNGEQFSVTVSNSAGTVTSNGATLTVTNAAVAPSISGQPVNQTVSAGQTATFSVTASGTAPLNYQWNKNGVAISGANGSTYITPVTATSDSGTVFTVTVSNSVNSITSSAATLTVNAGVYVISAAPNAFSFSGTANGGAPALQTVVFISTPATALSFTMTADQPWITMSANSGVTKATLQLGVNPASMTAGNYSGHVLVTPAGAGNPPLTIPVSLTLTAGAVAPSISAQPANQTVTAGQTATFAVTAAGTAPLSYQWNKSGVAISGATGASYTTPATATTDSGSTFTVTVSNSVSSVTSNAASLTVNAPTYVISAAPNVFAFTGNVNGAAPALQSVAFVSTPATALSFTMTADQSWITMSANSGVTKATLQLGANTAGMTAGSYSGHVVVTPSGAGNPPLTIPVSLTLTTAAVAPSISSQPMPQSVTAGQTATFSVAASGTAPLAYQWNKNGAAIGGATAASYTTPATVIGDNASQFSVTVSNGTGSVTSNSAALSVVAAPVAPSISVQPASQSVTAGQTATFSVTAAGTAPLTYQWNKNGAPISGATAASYTTPVTVVGDNGTQFSVTVSNSVGNVTSSNAVLTVAAASVAPSITTQPVSQTVTSGQTASFSVTATGTAPLTYQWNKNGAAISGATASSYTTAATANGDTGSTFTVTVSNSVNSVTSSAATLTVNPIYVISASPTAFSFSGTVNGSTPAQQAVVFISTPATALPFTMTANQPWITMSASSGVTKATIQLGVNISGMSAGTYNGQVQVTPTGAGDPPITIPVSLTLTAPAPGTLTPSVTTLNFNNVSVGSNSTLQATLTNSGSTNVIISNVSMSGAGFSASGVPSGTILGAGQTAILNVTFAPSATGVVNGSVTVSSNASNSSVGIALTGDGVQVVQHSVALTWASSGSSIAGYNVYQGTVSGGPYTKLNPALVSSQSYADTTVQAGQTYYYVVTSVNASGVESGYSNEVSVTIPLS